MPYPEYLKTPEWRARREEHIRKVGGRCQVSNNHLGNRLELHHRTYERLGNEKFVDLIAMAPGLHEAFHAQLAKHGPYRHRQGGATQEPRQDARPSGAPQPLSDEDLHRLAHLLVTERTAPSPAPRGRRRWALTGAAAAGVVAVVIAALLLAQPGSDTATDYDCGSISYAQAQEILREDPSDPHRLDQNADGEACESSR